jgi:hypothetical protein
VSGGPLQELSQRFVEGGIVMYPLVLLLLLGAGTVTAGLSRRRTQRASGR